MPHTDTQPREPQQEFLFTEQDFRYLSRLVKEHMGIVLGDNKKAMVYSRIAWRLRELKLKSFHAYCALLEGDPEHQEMTHCLNALTTNLTGFFRESHHFDHLRELLTRLVENPKNRDKRLRLWSAACSSGQEPYSMAMVVDEVLTGKPGWDVKILATDIDSNMVATAKKGEYPRHLEEKIPAQYRKQYTIRAGGPGSDTFRITDNIRRYITFNTLNLLGDWPFKGPFDVVFCRNVVIYFDRPTQIVLFDRMAEKMQPDGWLYIGHSESLFKVSDRFRLEGKTTYQRMR